jgi:phosphonoacetaldehyde hydrolase
MADNQIRAIVFDWAGTMVDYGCMGPAKVFQEIFKQEGINVTDSEAREPMGMAKREHIAAVGRLSNIDMQWRDKHGASVGESDVDRMYAKFLPLQLQVLAEHSEIIPGAVESFNWCIANSIRVGSSTGYTRQLMDVVEPIANAAGYRPEVVLCAEDAPQGRPAPWLIFECAKRFGVYPMNRIVKVDDTIVGVQAGINAGAWSIGVAQTGNMIGLSQIQWSVLSESDQLQRLALARQKLKDAGAHFVIDSVAEIPQTIRTINETLARNQNQATYCK